MPPSLSLSNMPIAPSRVYQPAGAENRVRSNSLERHIPQFHQMELEDHSPTPSHNHSLAKSIANAMAIGGGVIGLGAGTVGIVAAMAGILSASLFSSVSGENTPFEAINVARYCGIVAGESLAIGALGGIARLLLREKTPAEHFEA